jgi:thiol-disulfide isomerase/thioredoxin
MRRGESGLAAGAAMNRFRATSVVLVALSLAVSAGCGGSGTPPEAPSIPIPMPQPSRALLAVGEPFPPLDCEGWIQGEPKPFVPGSAALHVVDVWSLWCPECQKLAPSLRILQARYRDQNVQFVSVTDLPRDAAERFYSENGYTWPRGYGLKEATIRGLGAVNSGMGMYMSNYLVAPTIFVVGPDGTVRGTDGQARWRHRPTNDTVALVSQVIDEALAQRKAKD